MTAKQLWQLTKQAAAAWVDDYAPSMGAAIAYYTMFSIAPLLLIVIALAGLVFGHDAASGEVLAQLRGLVGEAGAQAVQGLLESASRPGESLVATLLGGVLLLIGATSVFGELQDALDRIWRAPMRDKPGGLWGLLRSRLLSFGMILGIGFLLMVSLLMGAGLAAVGKWMEPLYAGWELVASGVNFILSYALVAGMFAMIYKIMPRVRIAWPDVWAGALVTAMLFNIGKLLIGLYIGKIAVASAFGAAGSLVVLLLWVYYSAQIFLLGAEFTWAYAHTCGSRRGDRTRGAAVAIPERSGALDAGVRPPPPVRPLSTAPARASVALPSARPSLRMWGVGMLAAGLFGVSFKLASSWLRRRSS